MLAFADTVLLIPSLEPDSRLPRYIGQLIDRGFSKIVVVDDGSGQSYQPIFEEIAALPPCHVLHHDVNRGKGAALKTGYKYIMENYHQAAGVITADSDGQHRPDDCVKLAEKLAEGRDELYLGSRDFSLPDVPPKSRMGNRITSVVFSLLYQAKLPDTQTGLRAFPVSRLPFMLDVPGERFEYEMNVLIACARAKIPMVPVTIETVYENGNSGTHFHPIRDSWKIYRVIFANFFKFMGASILSFLIDYGLAWLFNWFLLRFAGIDEAAAIWVSGFAARIISSVCNFNMNKTFVFKLKKGNHTFLKYAALCVLIICLSNLGVTLLTLIHIPSRVGKLVCDCLLYFLSYRIQNDWVFAESREKKGEK